MTTSPLSCPFSHLEERVGTSPLQGPHQVRKTSTRTVCPWNWSREIGGVLYHCFTSRLAFWPTWALAVAATARQAKAGKRRFIVDSSEVSARRECRARPPRLEPGHSPGKARAAEGSCKPPAARRKLMSPVDRRGSGLDRSARRLGGGHADGL